MRSRLASFAPLLLAAALQAAGAQGQPPGRGGSTVPRWNPDPESLLLPQPVPATVKDGFRLVTLGDLLYWRPVRAQIDSGMDAALRIVRDADFATANLEGTFFDIRTNHIPPHENGILMPGSPDLGEDIKNLGVRLVSKANNHTVDWGVEGMNATRRLLEAAHLPYAGVGDNRQAARMATFVDLPKGRVGVVSAASSHQEGAIPLDADADVAARPGMSVLRTTSVHTVTAKEMAVLQRMDSVRIAAGLTIGGNAGGRGGGRGGASDAKELTLLGQTYRLGERAGWTWSMNRLDEFEILREVRSAKKLSDLVIFTIHAHEGPDAPGEGDGPYPADFLPVLFHHVIDAGADVVAGHGSHALRGIEIYKGRPIFYGLSTFIFQGYIYATQDSRDAQGVDQRYTSRGEMEVRLNGSAPAGAVDSTGLLGSWNVTILPQMTFEGGRVKEIRIYPIDVRRNAGSKQSGLPRMAPPELGHKILTLVRDLSKQFGTNVQIEGNVGVVRP